MNVASLTVLVSFVALSALLTGPAVGQEPDPAEPRDLAGRPRPALERVPPNVEQSTAYTWRDGDRTRTVFVDPSLVFTQERGAAFAVEEVAETGFGSIVRVAAESRDVSGDLGEDAQPVFRDRNGGLRALPGGVLLVFDKEWSAARISAFLASNGIGSSRVSPLGEIPNGFVVSTGPGFASLNLANELADQEGVKISSPNWWTERVTR